MKLSKEAFGKAAEIYDSFREMNKADAKIRDLASNDSVVISLKSHYTGKEKANLLLEGDHLLIEKLREMVITDLITKKKRAEDRLIKSL